MTIKVVLIDESPIFRSGLTKNLTDAEIEIVGEATNGIMKQSIRIHVSEFFPFH
jgi:DNA-binding NarL/FixJ family response regulator